MRIRATYCGNDTLAYTGDNGFFACAADKPCDVGADGNSCFYAQFDTVFSDSRDCGSFDDFGIDAYLNGIEHVSAGKVDGFRRAKRQVDIRAVCGNKSVYDFKHVAARHIVRFEFDDIDIETRFCCVDIRLDYHTDIYAAKSHTNETPHRNPCARYQCAEPCAHGHECKKYCK